MPEKWRQIKENETRHKEEMVSGRGVEPRTHGLRVRSGALCSAVPPPFAPHAPSISPVLSPFPGAPSADHPSADVRPVRPSRGRCRHGCRQLSRCSFLAPSSRGALSAVGTDPTPGAWKEASGGVMAPSPGVIDPGARNGSRDPTGRARRRAPAPERRRARRVPPPRFSGGCRSRLAASGRAAPRTRVGM